MVGLQREIGQLAREEDRLSQMCDKDLRELIQSVDRVSQTMQTLLISKEQAKRDEVNHSMSPRNRVDA